MADFIDILQDIRGTGTDLNAVGNPANAGNPAGADSGGIWQRLKDKEAKVNNTFTENTGLNNNIVAIKKDMYSGNADTGTPATPAAGTVLLDITTKHDTVNSKSTTVNDQFHAIAGADGTGNTDGMHKVVVEKEALVNPHYGHIDTVGADLADANSKVSKVSTNLAKGVNSEVVVIGNDLLLGANSNVKIVSDIHADVSTVSGIHANVSTVASSNTKIVKIGDDLLDANSKITEVYNDLTDNNKKYIQSVAEDIQDNAKKFMQSVGTNLQKGASSEVVGVGVDLQLGVNSNVVKVGTNLLKGANSEVNKVGVDLLDGHSNVVAVGVNLQKGATSEILLAPAAAIKAQEWAEKATEVEPGSSSAKHWAGVASQIATGDLIEDLNTNEVKVFSSFRTDRMTKAVVASMSQLGDATCELLVGDQGGLVVGDTEIDWTIGSGSDNANVFVLDDANDRVTLKRKTSYSAILDLRISSAVNATRTITVSARDTGNADAILASDGYQIDVKNGTEKKYMFVLPLDVATADTVVRFVINIDGDAYSLKSGTIRCISSVSQDIDVDVSGAQLDIIRLDADENTANSVASKVKAHKDEAVAHTKAQVGLANVDNTSDADKPVSTAVEAAKADKAQTSGTSTRYTDTNADGNHAYEYKMYMENGDMIWERTA